MQKAIQHIQVCWTSINRWKYDTLKQQHFFWFQYVIWFIVASAMIESSLPSTLLQVCWPDGNNLNILGWHPPWSSFLICTIGVSKLRTSCTKTSWELSKDMIMSWDDARNMETYKKKVSDAKIVNMWIEENSDFALFPESGVMQRWSLRWKDTVHSRHLDTLVERHDV